MKTLSRKIVIAGITTLFAIVISACGNDNTSSTSANQDANINEYTELSNDSENESSSNSKAKNSSSSKKITPLSNSSSSIKQDEKDSSDEDDYDDDDHDDDYDDDDDDDDDDDYEDDDDDDYDDNYDDDDNEIESSSSQTESDFKGCTHGDEGVFWINNARVTKKCVNGTWETLSSSSECNPVSSFDITLQFNPEKKYEKITDTRDGKTYRTIKIWYGTIGMSDSMTIFAENLNYGTQVNSGTKKFDDRIVEKFCYNDDPWYCDNGYGGLYTWAEAMNLPQACNNELIGTTDSCPIQLVDNEDQWFELEYQGICPNGWHILNAADRKLIIAQYGIDRDATELMSRAAGAYDDYFGLSFFFSGFYDNAENAYKDAFLSLTHWTPQEQSANMAKVFYALKGYRDIDLTGDYKSNANSIRCVLNRASN